MCLYVQCTSVPVPRYEEAKHVLFNKKYATISCFLTVNLNTHQVYMYRCIHVCTGVLQLLLDRYTSGTHVIRTGSSRKSVVTVTGHVRGTQYTTVLLIIFVQVCVSWVLGPGSWVWRTRLCTCTVNTDSFVHSK